MSDNASDRTLETAGADASDGGWLVDIGLLTLVVFLLVGWPPPDVNEAHYLGKAKHYWDPDWCSGDLFLESGDAHGVFYWTCGWLTRFVSLPAAAWLGRLLSWILLAWSWTALSRVFAPSRLWAVLSGALLAALIARGQMAGEWLFGGVEAKSFAYALVFLGLRFAALGRWHYAGAAMGIAVAFHVLVGGWSWIALALGWLVIGRSETPLRQLLPFWIGGAIVALLGVGPALWLNHGVDAETQAAANQVYVFERLAHHLLFRRFDAFHVIRHGALVTAWAWLAIFNFRDRGLVRINAFVAAATLIAVFGIAIDFVLASQPDLAASLLRYYWFRLSDIATPIGVALMVVSMLRQWWERDTAVGQLAFAIVLLATAAHVIDVHRQGRYDMRPASVRQPLGRRRMTEDERQAWFADWRSACDWIKENAPSDACFLTPRHQQTFKWYAHRAEAVNWKDVPQDAEALVQWRERMRAIHGNRRSRLRGLAGHGESGLRELGDRFGCQYVILERPRSGPRLRLPRVYPRDIRENTRFVIYQLEREQ